MGEVQQGPNGDLCSMFFQLIDERTGNTHTPIVQSFLDDASPAAIKQKKLEVHHLLAKFPKGVVAEGASKRLLPVLNQKQKAGRCEQIGTYVAKTGHGASWHLDQT